MFRLFDGQIEGSVAYWDDRLRPDDQILEINETDMRNGTQEQAVDIIQVWCTRCVHRHIHKYIYTHLQISVYVPTYIQTYMHMYNCTYT